MDESSLTGRETSRDGLRELQRKANLAWIVCAVVVVTIVGSIVRYAFEDFDEFHLLARQSVNLVGASTSDRLEFALGEIALSLGRHGPSHINVRGDDAEGPTGQTAGRLRMVPHVTGLVVIDEEGRILLAEGREAPSEATIARLIEGSEISGAPSADLRYAIIEAEEWGGETRVVVSVAADQSDAGSDRRICGVVDPEFLMAAFAGVTDRIGRAGFDVAGADAALYRADGESLIPLSPGGQTAPASAITAATWPQPTGGLEGAAVPIETGGYIISRRPIAGGDLVVIAWRPKGSFLFAWIAEEFGFLGISLSAVVAVIVFTLFAMQNIARSQRAEKALRERDRRIRDVMNNMVDGIITIGENGAIESFNRAAEKIFGYDAAEMIGRNVSVLMPEPDRDRHDGYLRHHLETGERKILGVGPRELLAQHKDGSTFPMELLTTDMHVDGRRIFIGSVRDISRRKTAESALDESQRTLRAVVDAIPAGVNATDREGRLIFINAYQAARFNVDADSVVGESLSKFRTAAHAEQIRAWNAEVFASGRALTNIDDDVLEADGETRNWHVTKAPVFDEAGNVASVVTVALDVTDQRKSHEALKQSERQLAEAHRIAGLGSWETNMETDRHEWSDEVFRIFGVSPDDFDHTSQAFFDYVHPEDVELVRQLIHAVITEGYPFSIQHRIVRPDGAVRVVQQEAVVIRDENGRVIRMRGTVQDITERAEAEAALRESRARLAHAQRLAGFGHCIWDEKNQRLAYCSIEVAELFGVPRRSFPKMHYDLLDFVDPGDRERVRSATESAKAGEHAYEIEYGIVRPDGGLRSVVEIGEVVLDPSGRIDRTVSTFQDITERKRVVEELRAAKEEAELASRAKSEFLANMSHELRTPLNAIIGFSEMILGTFFGPVGSAKYLEYSQSIKDSGAHLLEIINDILDLSKIETNTVVPDDDDVDVDRVVRSCLTLVNDRATVGRLTVDVNIPDDAPTLCADERMVKQILLNLLSNAVKFTPAGGKISVKVSASARDGYEFRVSDTGIGIAPEDIPTAMMPFAQVDSGLSRKYEGTGLGLPLTKGLVELHGGTLEISSKVAAGTTVTVRFPPSRVGPSSSAGSKASSSA